MKDRKRFVIFLVIGVLVFSGVPVAARFIRELVEVYKFNISTFPKNYVTSLFFDKKTYTSFLKFNNPINAIGWVAIGWYILSYIIGRFGLFKFHTSYEQTEEYGSHGTSRWQTEAEIKNDYYNGDVGWFLGSLKDGNTYKIGANAACHQVENKTKLNMQVVVVGPPGSNKTTGFVLPNIFHLINAYKSRNLKIKEFRNIVSNIKANGANILKVFTLKNKYKEVRKGFRKEVADYTGLNIIQKIEVLFKSKINNVKAKFTDIFTIGEPINEEMPDLIITDPKPELCPLTMEYLQNNGYDMKVLDFIDLKYGDSLNVLDFINDDKTLMEIAQGYIESVSGSGENSSGGDQKFWNDQEAQVLAALMGFIKQVYPKEKQNLTEISKILVSEDVSDIDSARFFFKENGVTGAPEQLWNNFLMLADSERTRANILGGLAEKLKLFAVKGIQDITNSTTVDISMIGAKKEKPMALFILMPDGDDTFAPIINVVITSLFKQLYKTARKTNARLENPVYFILEEMANIGKIPGIKKMLGTMRGRRIYPMMIWQSLSQMKERYGDKGFEDIMSMCDSHIYLGINDKFTAEYCSDSLGNTTIKIQGVSQKADDGVFTINEKSESQSYQPRKLKFPEECRRMDNSKIILVQRAKFPVELYKVQYTYWENKICKTRDIQSLPEILLQPNKIKEEQEDVINITRERNIEKSKHIESKKIEEVKVVAKEEVAAEKMDNVERDNDNHVESTDFSLDNVEIDLEALKCFSEQNNEYDIEV